MEELVKAVKNINLNKSSDSRTNEANHHRINLHYGSKYKEDNFCAISIYPTTSDLISGEKSYIRENVVDSRYTNVYDYLDTHFRLLREDFVNPIREDICGYILNPQKKYFNIEVHEIQFLRKGVKRDKKCCSLEIKKSIVNLWNITRNQKRFMLGSLLLFTDDDFKTIFCGKVEDTRNLKYKKILVSFEKENVQIIYGKDYLMVECKIFFEPYYRVLKVLQEMPLINFPMEKYLIYVNTSTELPYYLDGIRPAVLDDTLNESQMKALRGALSQECAIIQGPPGTGKTFLGLKLAKLLLANDSKWWNDSPMLIISLTNHALDQFLEGLLGTTDKVLRLGGQSKSGLLKNYTISETRKKFRNTSADTNGKTLAPYYKALCRIERRIKSVGDQLDNINTKRPTCIFYLSILSSKVPQLQGWYSSSKHEELVSWLLEDDGTIINNNEIPSSFEGDKSQDAKDLIKLWKLCLSDAHKGSSYCMVSTSIMAKAGDKLKAYIDNQNVDDAEAKVFSQLPIYELNEHYEYLMEKIDYLKLCLRTTFDSVDVSSVNLNDPFKIPVKVRWQLYNSWLRVYQEKLTQELDKLIEEQKPAFKVFNELSTNNTLHIIKQMKVVGMTTTCAARMRATLEALKSPILIVEEAAEVLEAHIIAALTAHCKHLVLIGDHKQLKPATSDYNIETNYKLGISLFERMVINNIPCHVLNVQHRMRPEISSLVAPYIYPDLINHDSVKKFPNILGMDKNVYFIDHTEEEQRTGDASKRNLYEVKFLIQLAIYLINNNHSPKHITILAAYLGQKAALIEERKNCTEELVKQVQIATVDNFQGEENDIILLSLVRSNRNKRIGFLSTENRVCVALSRAKMGLYIIGNMRQLTATSKFWRSVNKTLESQDGIGETLLLRCQNHNISTLISHPDDFHKVSDGGCSLPCNFVLRCGHKCTKNCHVTDAGHVKFQCLQPCKRSLCDNGLHKCKQKCFMDCGRCNYPLNSYLPCGHPKKCYMSKSNNNTCEEIVLVDFSCGHILEMLCYERKTEHACEK